MSHSSNRIIERYERHAADYERYWAPVLAATVGRLPEYVDDYARFVLRRDERLRVLEVGVGPGSLLRAALAKWPRAEIVATDGAVAMIELARQHLKAAAPAALERVVFHAAPADALPVADSSIDLVVSSFVLQLVPDRLAALREAQRVLAAGGMVGYVTWLDRQARRPFRPADEFDEAVFALGIDEPDGPEEPHAGDVQSGRAAAGELRAVGFIKATADERILQYDWSPESYLEYKLAYDERALLKELDADQRSRLEGGARRRLAALAPHEFRWHAPVVFARAEKARRQAS